MLLLLTIIHDGSTALVFCDFWVQSEPGLQIKNKFFTNTILYCCISVWKWLMGGKVWLISLIWLVPDSDKFPSRWSPRLWWRVCMCHPRGGGADGSHLSTSLSPCTTTPTTMLEIQVIRSQQCTIIVFDIWKFDDACPYVATILG